MNQTVSILGGVLCLGLAGASAYWSIPRPTTATPVAEPLELAVDPLLFDFGTVGQHESHVACFTLTNHHPHPITFGVIGKTCSCTTADLAEQTLRPGQATVLAVQWKSGSRQGRSTDHLTLTYEIAGPEVMPGSVRVGLSSSVQPDLLASDEAVQFKTGQPGEFVLRLRLRPGIAPVRLTWVGATHPCLKAEVVPGELAVRVRYDGSRLNVVGDGPEVQVQAVGQVDSYLVVPVRIGPQ